MKTKIIVTILMTVLLLHSCKEKQNDAPCDSYAPEGVTVSWTDYNSVREFLDYFTCHPATIKEHAGDTIKVTGWLYYGEPGVDAMVWDETELDYSQGFFLTSNSNHNGYLENGNPNTIRIGLGGKEYNSEMLSYFREHLIIFSQKKLFITGIIEYLDIPPTTGCCYRLTSLSAITIDTNITQ